MRYVIEGLPLQEFGPDVLVSYLHKEKIPAETLAKYRLALNFHPAPLPEYRGFAPYTFGILNGEREWGVSCHHMTAEIDAGPIVEVRRFPIENPDEVTAASLKEQTMPHLANLFRDVMERVARGEELPRLEQGYIGSRSAYYSKAHFETRRTHNADVSFSLISDREIRAFWCPPHAGMEFLGYTLAPHSIAGCK